MKNQNMQDERITAQRRKINSEAYAIIMFILLSSVLIQQYILRVAFAQYAVEFICFIGLSFYVIIRYMTLGLNIYGEGRRAKIVLLLNSIVTGIAVTVINGILNYTKYVSQYKKDGIGYFIALLAITFICSTVSVFIVLSFISYLNKKKQEKIQKQLDEDENDE